MSSLEGVSCQIVEERNEEFKRLRRVLAPDLLGEVTSGRSLCMGLFHKEKLRGFFVLGDAEGKVLSVKAFHLVDAEVGKARGYDVALYDYMNLMVSTRKLDSVKVESADADSKTFLESKGVVVSQLPAAPVASLAFASVAPPAQRAEDVSIPRKTVKASEDHSRKRGRDDEPVAEAGREDRGLKSQYSAAAAGAGGGASGGFGMVPTEGRFSAPMRAERPVFANPYSRVPQHHECTLKNPYVGFIASGRKTFEGRINTGFFKNYRVGDLVTWKSHTVSVTTEITERREFSPAGGFSEMLKNVGYQKLVPETQSYEQALAVYNGIPGYKDKVAKFGALAFALSVIKPSTDSRPVFHASGMGR